MNNFFNDLYFFKDKVIFQEVKTAKGCRKI